MKTNHRIRVLAPAVFALGLLLYLPWPYFIGCVIAAGLLIYEHRVLSPRDMSRLGMVFLRINALISVVVFSFTLLAVLLPR